MNAYGRSAIRHALDAEKLKKALDGDLAAANSALKYLSSSNPSLRQIMREAIHDLEDPRIWSALLRSFVFNRWNDHQDCERRANPDASAQIDESIIEVFLQDEREGEKRIKEAALVRGLASARPELRFGAAYLLGLRGDLQALPALDEAIEHGTKIWKTRAVRALTAINHERCGPALFKALAGYRGGLHREATLALKLLGHRAQATWLAALDHRDSHIRWHAARGLGEIGDARAAAMLAEGLLDENRRVRWATADVLAYLGGPAVPATLKILSRQPLNEQLRQACFHALNGIQSRDIRARIEPLLAALQGPAPAIEAPAAAQQLLMDWQVLG